MPSWQNFDRLLAKVGNCNKMGQRSVQKAAIEDPSSIHPLSKRFLIHISTAEHDHDISIPPGVTLPVRIAAVVIAPDGSLRMP